MWHFAAGQDGASVNVEIAGLYPLTLRARQEVEKELMDVMENEGASQLHVAPKQLPVSVTVDYRLFIQCLFRLRAELKDVNISLISKILFFLFICLCAEVFTLRRSLICWNVTVTMFPPLLPLLWLSRCAVAQTEANDRALKCVGNGQSHWCNTVHVARYASPPPSPSLTPTLLLFCSASSLLFSSPPRPPPPPHAVILPPHTWETAQILSSSRHIFNTTLHRRASLSGLSSIWNFKPD